MTAVADSSQAMQPAQAARLVKYNDFYKPPPPLGQIHVWIQRRGEAGACDNKRKNKQEQARIKQGAVLRQDCKSKAPGAVIRPGAAREFQFPEYGI
jgi:hypothetical protein